ncbi:hypothetical protein [Thioclava sp. GXIMD2076]|uniref:hypothetical protein n=1 Tax=Thioclava sp. GXIMD2076 TaxID=3131931 RepID=UPI0030D1BB41
MAIFSIIAATSWGAAYAATTVGAAVIAVGQAVTWSLASSLLMRSNTSRQTVQATIQQTDQPRVRAYGRNLLGGVKAFYESHDDRLYQIVVAHHGPIDAAVNVWWDGTPNSLAAAEDNHLYLRRYQIFEWRDGASAGGDYADVLSNFSALWTADHALEGQATFLTVFGDPSDENFPKVFPKGAQTVVQMEVRASQVEDLTGAMVYSENPGLILRDFFTHADGWALPASRLDDDSFGTFSAICAFSMALANGGEEPRYSLCGYYTLEEPLKNVAARFLAVCDGQPYMTPEGKLGICGGVWSEPDVTITAEDILAIQMQDGIDPMTAYNVLQGSFVSPAHAYQSIDVAELRDENALVTEEQRTDRLDLEACPSGTQLQRLMSIKMAQDRCDWKGTITTNLVGLKARFPKGDGAHTIRIYAPDLGIDRTFKVTSHSFDLVSATCSIGVETLDASAYAWDPATDERALPLTYAAIGTPSHTQPAPQNPVLTQTRVQVSGDTQAVKLNVSVDEPGKDSLTFQAQIAVGYWEDPEADTTWVDMSAGLVSAISGVLEDGQTYTVRMRWKGRSDWVIAGSTQVSANPDEPDPPAEFSALATGSAVALDWRNASEDFYRTQIWRGASSDFAAAVFVANVAGVAGQVSDFTDEPGVGTWSYFAVTINGSAVPSDPAGPQTITIS